jgi:hypothetical protein
MSARVSIRKSGAAVRPWEVRCSECREETLHFTPFGAVAANTRGIGNRVWFLALLAGLLHLHEKHPPEILQPDGCARCGDDLLDRECLTCSWRKPISLEFLLRGAT